jgi:hypothetical protein
MEPNSILLVTITVFVALMTIGLWGILFALAKAHTGANAERNAAVRGISEECAEAEKVLSSSAAKAMNAHGLKSALLPKIEKMQKMLLINMGVLDVYFVKYMETRLSAFQAAFAETGTGQLFPIDKFLSEPKPAAPSGEMPEEMHLQDKQGAFAYTLKSRVESMPHVPAPQETALVKEKAGEEQFEPPAIDLRTGVITVAQEEPKQEKTVEHKPLSTRGPEKPVGPRVERTPAKPLKKKTEQRAPEAEDEFDFEKEIAANVDVAINADFGRGALDTKELHTEKTMRWDKEELTGMAGKPESIVVEGTEAVKAKAVSGQKQTSDMPDAAHEQAMISGEDIESTLDSFFGLGDK